MSIIRANINTRMEMVNGIVMGGEIEAEFRWDPEDPLAVQMLFLDENGEIVEWEVSRELLNGGALSPVRYGYGDVRMRFEGFETGRTIMCLMPPKGHACLTVSTDNLLAFLNLTKMVVPLGTESVGADLDEELKWILS